MKSIKYIIGPHGYPSKKYIRHLLNKYNEALEPYQMEVNIKRIVFNEGYMEEDKGAGILWRPESSMEAMDGFDTYLMEHGVKISRVKYWGQIHSIWLTCENG